MEAKINVAEILKDKPKGTKIYADAFGELSLKFINLSRDNGIYVKTKTFNCCSFYSDGKYTKDGESILVPSKEMRDWSKFAWKKGDVLANNIKTIFIIFNGFEDDTYLTFKGKYCLTKISSEEEYTNEESNFSTSLFEKANNDEAHAYINTIEERLGGKLNRETLEIEKQPEFKDGDIVTAFFADGNEMICVFKEKIEQDYMAYCGFFYKGKHEGEMYLGYDCIYNDDPLCNKIRFATEEEKQKLFEALAKENKAWNAEKKAIVDLKPKCEFKPFDRCIWKIRNCEGSIWRASFVSYVDEYGAIPMGMSIDEDLVNLIILPYNDETAKLIGTTDNWEG